jgi:hypothetical protein
MKWKDRGRGRRILSDLSLHIAMVVRTIMGSVVVNRFVLNYIEMNYDLRLVSRGLEDT